MNYCGECKHYREWNTWEEFGNECKMFGYEYFKPHMCELVDENGDLNEDGKEFLGVE